MSFCSRMGYPNHNLFILIISIFGITYLFSNILAFRSLWFLDLPLCFFDQHSFAYFTLILDLGPLSLVLQINQHISVSLFFKICFSSNHFFFIVKFLDFAIFFFRYDRIWIDGVRSMMISLYHQEKTPIGFWCKRDLNPDSYVTTRNLTSWAK